MTTHHQMPNFDDLMNPLLHSLHALGGDSADHHRFSKPGKNLRRLISEIPLCSAFQSPQKPKKDQNSEAIT